MFQKLRLLISDHDLRKKLFFILGVLAVFRILAAIPVPSVDRVQLKNFLAGNQFFGLLNVFSGGVLDNLSIAMLGVGPYITGSIIMQLLTMIFPKLKEIYQEEGEAGRTKFNQYSRILAVPLSILQAFGLLTILIRQQVIPALTPFGYLTNIAIVTAGTMILMWLGELITEKGFGNGVSLMIFAGIVSRLPVDIRHALATFETSQLITYAAFLAVGHVPAGVPACWAQATSQFLISVFNNTWIYAAIYFVLVFAFTYFYTAVTFDPQAIATNIQKQGGFILGIRPGRPTAEHLYRILSRVTLAGALFLGAIAVLPIVVQNLSGISAFQLGGTSLLIAVSVILETMKQVDAQLVMREYE